MRLELRDVGVGTGPGAALPPISVTADRLRPGVVGVETVDAPVLASLVAGGRMRPEHGEVTLDGHPDPDAVRRAFALVDTPTVAEPFPTLRVDQVVREELVLAGQRGDRGTVAAFLEAVGLTEHARTRMQALPTAERVRMLTELALLRPGVHGLVVTSPERHGGDVARWLGVVQGLVERGVTVLVVASVAAADSAAALLPATDPETEPESEPEPEPETDLEPRPEPSPAPAPEPAAPTSSAPPATTRPDDDAVAARAEGDPS